MSNNTSVVAYLRHHGGTMYRRLCLMASVIALWSEWHLFRLEASYIPGKKNILADQLSRPGQILPTEWSLLPRVFDGICWVLGHPHLDLFATRANNKLPILGLPCSESTGLETRRPSPSMESPRGVRLSPFALLCQVISRVMELEGLRLLLMAPPWPQKEWFMDLLDLLVAEPLELPRMWNLLVQPHIWKYHRASRPSDIMCGTYATTYLKGRMFEEGCTHCSDGAQTLHGFPLPVKVDPIPWLV